jgi:UPF0042 nucleotide-binding protein
LPIAAEDKPGLKNSRIVVITGLSGSGKSTASRALEDMGFFCVDNLPIALLPTLLELSSASVGEYTKIALVMDLREKEFLRTYREVFDSWKPRTKPWCAATVRPGEPIPWRRNRA